MESGLGFNQRPEERKACAVELGRLFPVPAETLTESEVTMVLQECAVTEGNGESYLFYVK